MAHILVVDDSQSMRDIISRVLLNAGHQIDTAVDGFFMIPARLIKKSHNAV